MPKQKYNVNEGLKNLKPLIKRFSEGRSSEPLSRPSRMFYHEGLGGIIMGREDSVEYEKVLQQLTPDEESGLRRSRGETDRLVEFCVLKALDVFEKQTGTNLNQRIESEINALRIQLTAPLVKWEVWRQVFGLKFPTDGFQFGTVLFCKPQHEAAKAAKGALESKIGATEHAKWYQENLNIWPDDSQDVVLCRVAVQAGGGEGARHLATVELDAILPVLNFFASLVIPIDSMPAFALRETSGPDAVTDFALSEDGGFHWQQTEWRISGKVDISELEKNEYIKSALQKASTMLRDEEDEGFRERLLAGMKWAGKGASARNKDEGFLFYAIGLESLILGGQHREQLSYRLRLRVGQLLGRARSGKTKIRDLTKRLYELRNAIAHTGKTDIASFDLDDLRVIIQTCIGVILCGEDFAGITSDDALEKWFEDALMNPPDAGPDKAETSP